MGRTKQTKVPPDGGWGWVVVAGVALLNVKACIFQLHYIRQLQFQSSNQSILSVFGLLFGEHLQNMGEGTVGAALITNLNSLALNLSGLFIGPAIKTFAPRRVAFAGCCLTSFGMLMCSISTKLWHVIVSYSIIVGLGLGLISPSAFMAINSYFKEKRGMAVGIAMAGTGVGQMLLPHIVRYLLDFYGFRMTAVVLGSVALQGLVGASLFRPLIPTKQQNCRNIKRVKLLLQNDKEHERDLQDHEMPRNDNPPNVVVKRKSLDDEEITFIESLEERKNRRKRLGLCQKILQRIVNAMDLNLLKDPIFVSLSVGIALVYTSTINFSMLFPYFLQYSSNLSRGDTAMCMSVLAGADIVCRIGFPMITDRLNISYRIVFLLGAVGMLVGRAILADTFNFYGLIVLSAVIGGFKSATVVNNNLAVSEYCSPETLPGGLGLNMIAKGIFAITVGQLLGWVRDYTGSYALCLHAQNIVVVVVLIMWIPEYIYKYVRRRILSRGKTNGISPT